MKPCIAKYDNHLNDIKMELDDTNNDLFLWLNSSKNDALNWLLVFYVFYSHHVLKNLLLETWLSEKMECSLFSERLVNDLCQI